MHGQGASMQCPYSSPGGTDGVKGTRGLGMKYSLSAGIDGSGQAH